ncbi:MAG TPA: ABC transporter ATP-binding protein [Candidatus Dojkabacteria bacterium]|nr:ABC transporter ATP-binding protein [Candidatus Dojkabacteria bacterium]
MAKISRRDFFIKYLKNYKQSIVIIVLALIVGSVCAIAIPYLINLTIDNVITPNDQSKLLKYALLILAVAIIEFISRYITIKTQGKLGQNLLFSLRQDLFEKIEELPMKYIVESKSGDLINRIISNVESVNRMISDGVGRLISVIATSLAILIAILVLDYRIGLVGLVPFVLVISVLYLQAKVLKSRIKRSYESESELSASIQESLSGFEIIKIFGNNALFEQNLQRGSSKVFSSNIKAGIIESIALPINILLTTAGRLLTLVYSLHLFSIGSMSLGLVVALVSYIQQLYQPLNNIEVLWRTIQNGLIATDRIIEIMSEESSIKQIEKPYSISKEKLKGKIEFKNVSFSYSKNQKVLNNINFIIEPGETVAIVGPTGGGKTTFVNLIARLYDVVEGSILIDDVDVRNWDIKILRKSIGYLLQDNFLFADTIANNLKYGNPTITDEQIKNIFCSLGANKIIDGLSDGINTKIDDNQTILSSGQKQLIAICRILLRDPKILILDEATSNIDSKWEKIIQQAIDKATKNITSIVIAHRLSTIKNADKIIFIENNKIAEAGTPEQLIKQKGKFYNLLNASKP